MTIIRNQSKLNPSNLVSFEMTRAISNMISRYITSLKCLIFGNQRSYRTYAIKDAIS